MPEGRHNLLVCILGCAFPEAISLAESVCVGYGVGFACQESELLSCC